MMDERSAFSILKPACNAVVSSPNVETILQLQVQLDLIPAQALQNLQSYVCFPLLLHLRNSAIENDVKQHLIDCITHILKKTRILTVTKLFEIYVPLFLHLFDPSKPSLLASTAEETKLSVVRCAAQLLRSASPEVLEQVYQAQYVPRLGQGIYLCMELLKSEKMRSLRLAVIQCVMVHCQVESDALFESRNLTFRRQVADIVSLILPGILVGLLKVIIGDPKVGHQVIQMAVRAWGRVVALVFEDRLGSAEPVVLVWHMNGCEEESENEYQMKSNEELQRLLSDPQGQRKWACCVGKKVGQQAELAVRAQSSDDWRVRLELVQVSHLILLHCARIVQSCQLPLLESLIALTEDSVEAVATASSRALSELAHLPQLIEALEENFYQVAVRLPRVVRTTGGKEQLSAARLLTGHMKLMGSKLPYVLSSHVHLEKLVLALVQAFQLNTSGISSLEAGSSQGVENTQIRIFGIGTPWKQYEFVDDQEVLESLESACSVLGQLSDHETLIHYFLDKLNEWPERRKELVLILNQILLTSLKLHDGDAVSLARSVVNVYIDPDIWSLPLSVDANVTLSQAQCNIVQASLLVEGIGKIATALGHKFQKLLLKTLYMVLERCGSRQLILQAAGIDAAHRVATACGHCGIKELVRTNQDYISFYVSRKLLHVRANPGVLDVLSFVLLHSDGEMLPHLQGIIQEVLLLNVGTFRDKRALPFLNVFHASIQALRRWNETSETCTVEIDTSVMKDIMEYHSHHTKVLSLMKETDEVENSTQEPSTDEQVEDEKKDEPPPLILLADSILQRLDPALPIEQRSIKRTQALVVLETLIEGVKLLEPHTTQLLPIVHQIWSPLVGRLAQRSDIVIMRRSFELLCTLARAARDFIRSRTLKDVLPSICSFLSKACAVNKHKHTSTAYTFTQEFKLQQELLDGLGNLAVCVDLMERDLDRILSVVLPYLSREQPKELQKSCLQLLTQLAKLDPDAVTLRLSDHLASRKVPTNEIDPYEQNVKLMLQSLQGLHSSEEVITTPTIAPSR